MRIFSGQVRRGRPLGYVSTAVLQKIGATGPMTSAQLSTALLLNRAHASTVCAKLAAAGHLQAVGNSGRHKVYAAAPVTAARHSLLILGGARR